MGNTIDRLDYLQKKEQEELVNLARCLLVDTQSGAVNFCALVISGPQINYAARTAGGNPSVRGERLLAAGHAAILEAQKLLSLIQHY